MDSKKADRCIPEQSYRSLFGKDETEEFVTPQQGDKQKNIRINNDHTMK